MVADYTKTHVQRITMSFIGHQGSPLPASPPLRSALLSSYKPLLQLVSNSMLWHTVGWREGSEVVMPYRQIQSKHMKVTDRLGLRSAHVVLQFPEIIGNISNKNVPAPCKMSENGLQMSVLTMLICFFLIISPLDRK